MEDSNVRGQLNPSSVKDKKDTIRFNQWCRFVRNKNENTYTFSHTILCLSLSTGVILSALMVLQW